MQSLFCEPLGNSSHLSTLRIPVNSSRSGSFAAKSCGFPPGFCATCLGNELILYPFSFWFIVLFESHSNAKDSANQPVFRRAVVYPDPKLNKIFVWE